MIGQAGVIVGLTGSLVVEGFGWDLLGFDSGTESVKGDLLFRALGLFGRRTNTILKE